MEDFDDIDNLVKAQLSQQEVLPSAENWELLKAKVSKEKQKRRRILVLFLIGLFGIGTIITYQFFNKNTITENPVTIDNTIEETCVELQEDSISDASNKNIPFANKTLKKQVGKTKIISKPLTAASSPKPIMKPVQQAAKRKAQYLVSKQKTNNTIASTSDSIVGIRKDVVVIDDALSVTLLNDGKKKKKKNKASEQVAFGDITLIAGVNNFLNTSKYNFEKSYYIEVGYFIDKKLKKGLYLNYGPSISFSNLLYEERVGTQIRQETFRELSFNGVATLEKSFSKFRVGLGGYLGYNLIEPKNRFLLNEVDLGDISRTFIYGVSTNIRYQKIGLIFKYELSPYYEIGAQKNNRFILGIRYVF